jgi:lipid II:glycine glycyltransferase (peptidoglycan interpeptide bridge formation enzyme)
MFEYDACATVIVVVQQNQVMGGAFNLDRKNAGLYSMYYCGIRDYHKKIFPTHLAIMGSMEWGMKNGCSWIDFMGAGKEGEEYGVRKYKEEFGGELTQYGRHLLVLQPMKYQLGKWGLKILTKLK